MRHRAVPIKPGASWWHPWPRAQAANARIRTVCEAEGKPRLRLVDVSTPLRGADGQPDPRLLLDDRLHLNNDGDAKWRAGRAPVPDGSR